MTTTRVIWTALPQGLDDTGRLLVTAFASIRLTGSGPLILDAFPAVRDWPKTVAQAQFTAMLGATAVPLTLSSDLAGADGLAWWHAILPGSTPVRSYTPDDFSDAEVVSYDPMALEAAISDFYADAALKVSSQALPTLAELGEGLRPSNAKRERLREQRLKQTGHVQPFVGRGLLGDPAMAQAIQKLEAYAEAGRPRPNQVDGSQPLPTKEEIIEQFDFHARLSSLGQHGALLQLLKIALQLRSTAPLPASGFANGGIRLICNWSGGALSSDALPDGAPVTKLSPGFRAAGKGVIVDGWLDPKASDLGVVQLDVEGAVRKLQGLDAADAGVAAAEMETTDQLMGLAETLSSEQASGLPALRSQGFALAFADQAKRLMTAFDQAKMLEAGLTGPAEPKANLAGTGWAGYVVTGSTPFYAEDLTRGFRVDVQHKQAGSGWRSLHRRSERYRTTGLDWTPDWPCEGMVRGALSKPGANPDPAAPFTAHPALAVWTGWSLSVPHPARAIGDEGAIGGPELIDPANPEMGLNLAVTPSGARGLPSLRYDHDYAFRVRAVDLAGQSVSPDAASPPSVSVAGERYDRFDPIEPPVMTFIDDPAGFPEAGESLHRLAIRTLADETGPGVGASRRLAFPPRAAFDQIERHGQLDVEGRVSVDRYEMLAKKDNKDSALPVKLVPLETPATGATEPSPVPGAPPRLVDQRCVPFDDRVPGYLPDPLAGHWRVQIDPVRASTLNLTQSITLDGAWPDWRSVEVRLEAGTEAGASVSADAIIVTLPPGEAVTVRLSAKAAEPKTFGVMRWAEKKAPGALVVPLQAAKAGEHWMVTPERTLELIHAVQQPVVAPRFGEAPASEAEPAPPPLTVRRAHSAREATLSFVTPIHLNSTRQIEVYSRWNDPTDAVGDADPSAPAFAAQSFVRAISDADYQAVDAWTVGQPTSTRLLPVSEVQAFPDTRCRWLTLEAGAASRFREYMPPLVRTDSKQGLEALTIRKGESVANAWLPSASRPPAPQVVSVIPTFAWERDAQAGAAEQSSLRRGGGFRVWLDRPWFATGFNEMLAVCLDVSPFRNSEGPFKGAPALAKELSDVERKRLTSKWGLDPLCLGDDVGVLHPGVFPRAVLKGGPEPTVPTAFSKPQFAAFKAALEALPDAPMRSLVTAPGAPASCLLVAPHQVDWDPERRLWFCDIEVETGAAYMPFVQLALARYQPMSVHRDLTAMPDPFNPGTSADQCGIAPSESTMEDLHLSEPVLTDFLQVLPDRLAKVSKAGGHVDIRIYGVGIAAESRSSRARFRLRLVKPISADGDIQPLGDIVEPTAIPIVVAQTALDLPVSINVEQITSAAVLPGPLVGASPTTTQWAPPQALIFSGRIPAPSGSIRLVIEEFELFPSDVFDAEQQFPPGIEPEGRLVYLEHFDL